MDRESPWYLVWVAVSSAIVVTLIDLIFNSGDVDWLMVVLLPVGPVIGTLLGHRLVRTGARSQRPAVNHTANLRTRNGPVSRNRGTGPFAM